MPVRFSAAGREKQSVASRTLPNELTGPIPAQLGDLANLEELYLSNNQLSGAIPAELGALSMLRSLYIQNNPLLTGCIPAALKDSLQDYGFGELNFCGT